MPGWLASTESLVRDKHCPTTEQEVVNSAKSTMAALSNSCIFSNPKTLNICLSLAATLRKLMWPHLHLLYDSHANDNVPTLPEHCELLDLVEPLLHHASLMSDFFKRAALGIHRINSNPASITRHGNITGTIPAGAVDGHLIDFFSESISSPCPSAPFCSSFLPTSCWQSRWLALHSCTNGALHSVMARAAPCTRQCGVQCWAWL